MSDVMHMPMTLDVHSDALFFDFDGTLVAIAERPDGVFLSSQVASSLTRLHELTGGAVAVLSGRGRGDLARYLPAEIPTAGLHGMEFPQHSVAAQAQARAHSMALEPLRESLAAVVVAHPGAELEDKGQALALHWRLAPDAEGPLSLAASDALSQLGDGWVLQEGKSVAEIRPKGDDKGDALRRFMAMPEFQGRRPVAFGDDLTDIAMLAAAKELGGLAVAIGERELPCDLRLADPDELSRLLERSLG